MAFKKSNYSKFSKQEREPTLMEIANYLKLEEKNLNKKLSLVRKVVSLDGYFTQEGDEISLWELVDDPKKPVDSFFEESILKGEIYKALSTLKKRDEQIIRMRFGIGGEVPRTLDEVGAVFNITRERVRQIEKKALTKLKLFSNLCGLKD